MNKTQHFSVFVILFVGLFIITQSSQLTTATHTDINKNIDRTGVCNAVFAHRLRLVEGTKKRQMEDIAYEDCLQPNPIPQTIILEPSVPMETTISNLARRDVEGGVIIENGLSPFPATTYLFTNHWYKKTDNNTITIYAGAKKTNQNSLTPQMQGVILFIYNSPDNPRKEEYLLPIDSDVRIVDIQATKIVLFSKINKLFFTFDMTSKEVSANLINEYKRLTEWGIITENPLSVDRKDGFLIENQFQYQNNEQIFKLLAGSEENQKAMMLLETYSLERPSELVNTFHISLPENIIYAGSLRIVDVQNNLVTLTIGTGAKIVFDLQTKQLVSWPQMP